MKAFYRARLQILPPKLRAPKSDFPLLAKQCKITMKICGDFQQDATFKYLWREKKK